MATSRLLNREREVVRPFMGLRTLQAQMRNLNIATAGSSPAATANNHSPRSLRRQAVLNDCKLDSDKKQQKYSTRKCVSISTDEPVVHEVDSLADYSPSEIEATWFSRDEFASIKSQYRELINKMRIHKDHHMTLMFETDEISVRGLECQSKAGSQRRKNVQVQAMAAVLDEQDRRRRQSLRGRKRHNNQKPTNNESSSSTSSSVDTIAILYRQCTYHAQQAALNMGRRDEYVIAPYYRPSSSSSPQSGIPVTASTLSGFRQQSYQSVSSPSGYESNDRNLSAIEGQRLPNAVRFDESHNHRMMMMRMRTPPATNHRQYQHPPSSRSSVLPSRRPLNLGLSNNTNTNGIGRNTQTVTTPTRKNKNNSNAQPSGRAAAA